MSRPRKPWFRAARDTWYVEIDGSQVPLAKGEHNKAAATKEYHRLMAVRDDPQGQATTAAASGSVVDVFGRFLTWLKKNKAPATYEHRRYYLESFLKFGRVRSTPPHRLTVALAEDWLDSHPNWRASRRHATLSVLRALTGRCGGSSWRPTPWPGSSCRWPGAS